jgi:lipopolysaccharide biosynthesis glycosyltransferase
MNNAMVLTITNDYADALRVFLYSYKQNNEYRPQCVVIEEEEITQENKNKILDIYPGTEFKCVDRDYSYNHKFKRRKWAINPANRFDIFTLPYDRIVFFDADMIVCKCVEELFQLPVKFGAVYHPNPDGSHSKTLVPNSKFLKNMNYDFAKSFNAGVMVISKDFLTKKTQDELFEVYKMADWLGNQGPLNFYFNKQVTLLSSNFFVSTPFINESNIISGKIFHYAGERKPWLTTSNNIEDNFDKGIVASAKNRILLLKLLTKYRQVLNKLND